jgi:DNA-binding transcriptional LysR family regulator
LHVVPVAAAFLEAHPEVDIQLRLGDRNVNLIEEHVDVALRIGALPDSNLVATQVGMIRRVVCASPAYLKRFGTPQSLDDLAAHRCITFDGLEASNAWTFADVDGQKQQVKVRSRMAVSTAEAAIEAAALGLGLTRVLSYQVADRAAGRQTRPRAGRQGAACSAGQSDLSWPGAAADEDPRFHRLRGRGVCAIGCRRSTTRAPPDHHGRSPRFGDGGEYSSGDTGWCALTTSPKRIAPVVITRAVMPPCPRIAA